MHRSKETALKVLSWLRSKAKNDADDAPFADAWRLDGTGAPQSLERAAARDARPAPRARPERAPAPFIEARPVQELRPAATRPTRPAREAVPASEARPATQPRLSPERRATVEQKIVQQLRTIQELRQVHELQDELQHDLQQKLQTEMEEPRRPQRRKPAPAPVPQESTLAAIGLVKAFGGRRVVNDVTIGLRRGEAVGLLGPNGAGKTTAFYMIVGLIKADAGAIELDGHDVTGLPMYRRARLGIGYLPQEPSIFRGLTVEDNIRSVLEAIEPDRAKREEELDRLLEEFNIDRIRKSPAIALSGGERRRVEIARALATRPSFMLLDEPFAGIDPIAVGDIQELVRHLTRRGIGVLITDHNVRETLGLVDRAYIVHSGAILMEGDPDEIVQSEKVRRVYLGEEFRL
jgi:lipopolysaccharide export system ATP-binding protein